MPWLPSQPDRAEVEVVAVVLDRGPVERAGVAIDRRQCPSVSSVPAPSLGLVDLVEP